VMLIGLLGKNAILIVEYANLKKKQGMPVLTAAIEGAVARLRPILMTSFAFAAGLIPLMVASGAGAVGNRTIGTASVGGMLIGTVLGVLVIPGLVVLFSQGRKTKHTAVKVFGFLVIFMFTACVTPKKIDSPALSSALKADGVAILQDTATLATVPWRSVFTDSLLKQYIEYALVHNRDLKQAIHRIELAQVGFRQRKAALFPSLEAAVDAGLRKYGHYTESGIGNYDSNFSEHLKSSELIPELTIDAAKVNENCL